MFKFVLFASLLLVSALGFDNSTVGSSTCGGKCGIYMYILCTDVLL